MRKGRTIRIALTVAVVGGALAYLLASGFGGQMIYYKTVDEVLADAARFEGRPVRVNGTLVPGSIRQRPGTDRFRFELAKRGKILEVSYSGVLPDSMQDGRELVVQGELQADGASFVATEILTKCPSKYEARARAIGP